MGLLPRPNSDDQSFCKVWDDQKFMIAIGRRHAFFVHQLADLFGIDDDA